MERILFLTVAVVMPILSAVSPVAAQESPDEDEVVVIGPVTPIFLNRTLLDLRAAKFPTRDDPVRDIHPRRITNPAALFRPRRVMTPRPDPLMDLQLQAKKQADRAFTTPNVNVAGMTPSCCPPDTVGEVGTTHFIQMMNGVGAGTNFQIFDKAGAKIGMPGVLEALAPIVDVCAGGDGDPIPLFDQLANRWILTQFETTNNALCLYLSSGADPTTSTWMLYRFDTPGPFFPDYPKYAVWPDAYYAATNDFGRLYAFDRANMLAGNPATAQLKTVTALPGFPFQITPPVDLGGPTAPPASSPGIFIRHRDDEAHDGATTPTVDTLEIFEFDPDFTTPANTTFTGPTSITVSDFDSDLCGLVSFECIPQPGTAQQLDPLREPVMNRPVYRNFGTHQTLIGSFATDVNGADKAGIRWFELRRAAGTTTGGWSLFQEGTLTAADTLSRWMGSLAMDKKGNMALGYSVSGPDAGQFPGIRYGGRLSTDTAGTMPQVETEIIAGTASQTISERWGDYSGMTVDPADDCTFWFTTEYTPSGLAGFPLTRVASFNFDSCLACSADPFEPDDNSGQAKPITPGVSKNHSICPVNDEDWSTFTLAELSAVTLTTSGFVGDTRMWLRDATTAQIEFDDDGAGLFSFIDRTCGVDALPAGTYFVEVDDSGDDSEIDNYSLDLTAAPCGCVVDLVLSNQTLSGTQTLEATSTAILGPNLIVNGSDIVVNAPIVTILSDTEISGTFSVGNNPACP